MQIIFTKDLSIASIDKTEDTKIFESFMTLSDFEVRAGYMHHAFHKISNPNKKPVRTLLCGLNANTESCDFMAYLAYKDGTETDAQKIFNFIYGQSDEVIERIQIDEDEVYTLAHVPDDGSISPFVIAEMLDNAVSNLALKRYFENKKKNSPSGELSPVEKLFKAIFQESYVFKLKNFTDIFEIYKYVPIDNEDILWESDGQYYISSINIGLSEFAEKLPQAEAEKIEDNHEPIGTMRYIIDNLTDADKNTLKGDYSDERELD